PCLYHRGHHASEDGGAGPGGASRRGAIVYLPHQGGVGRGFTKHDGSFGGQAVRGKLARGGEPFVEHAGGKPRGVSQAGSFDRRKEKTHMNTGPTIVFWFQLFGALALEASLIFLLAFGAQR